MFTISLKLHFCQFAPSLPTSSTHIQFSVHASALSRSIISPTPAGDFTIQEIKIIKRYVICRRDETIGNCSFITNQGSHLLRPPNQIITEERERAQ